MQVEARRPQGYEVGTYQLVIELDNLERRVWVRCQIPFEIPRLPYRSINGDDGYWKIDSRSGESRKMGVFRDRHWKGHCQTNSISEAQNPTAIGDVIEALRTEVAESLELAKRWAEGNYEK